MVPVAQFHHLSYFLELVFTTTIVNVLLIYVRPSARFQASILHTVFVCLFTQLMLPLCPLWSTNLNVPYNVLDLHSVLRVRHQEIQRYPAKDIIPRIVVMVSPLRHPTYFLEPAIVNVLLLRDGPSP